ncbi:MAG: DUF1818 family protein [Leptolyngbya sp. BL-A-14]
MARMVKSGLGWRIGWDTDAEVFKGLVGTDDWALELTEGELQDFCRLLHQLVETMVQISGELMDEERIACEAESDRLWLEVEGYPHAYSLQLMVLTGRRGEGRWAADAVPALAQAARSLDVF